MPGTDGGSVGISNTGRPRRCSRSDHTACGSSRPSTAGSPTRSPARSRPASCGHQRAAHRGVLERPRDALARSRPRGPSTGRSSSTPRASTRAPSRRRGCRRSRAGWKSLSWRKPTMQHRRRRRAGRRRASSPAPSRWAWARRPPWAAAGSPPAPPRVGVRRERARGDLLAQPLERGGHGRRAAAARTDGPGARRSPGAERARPGAVDAARGRSRARRRSRRSGASRRCPWPARARARRPRRAGRRP